jgi:hypothetical protein
MNWEPIAIRLAFKKALHTYLFRTHTVDKPLLNGAAYLRVIWGLSAGYLRLIPAFTRLLANTRYGVIIYLLLKSNAFGVGYLNKRLSR